MTVLFPNAVTLECSIGEQRSRTPHGSPLNKRLMYSIVLEKFSPQPLIAGKRVGQPPNFVGKKAFKFIGRPTKTLKSTSKVFF